MKWIAIIFLTLSLVHSQDYEFDKTTGKTKPKFVAETTLFKGEVYKVSGDKKEQVQVGTRFFENDTVETSAKSFIKFKVVDDTLMALGPNSNLNFSTFKFIAKSNRKAVYNLIKGQLRGHFKTKAKEGDLTVKTSSAAMGIRGTEILVTHQEVDFKELSDFVLLSGSAFIFDKEQQKIEIRRGERVTTLNDKDAKRSASEKRNLEPKEMQFLQANQVNEGKAFKPFLATIKPDQISRKSKLYRFFNKNAEGIDRDRKKNDEPVKRDETRSWRDKLNKLNEGRRDNNHGNRKRQQETQRKRHNKDNSAWRKKLKTLNKKLKHNNS